MNSLPRLNLGSSELSKNSSPLAGRFLKTLLSLTIVCFATTSLVAEQTTVPPPKSTIQTVTPPPPQLPPEETTSHADVPRGAAAVMAPPTRLTEEEMAIRKRNVMLGCCVAFFVVGLTASKIHEGKKAHSSRQ